MSGTNPEVRERFAMKASIPNESLMNEVSKKSDKAQCYTILYGRV